MLGALVRQSKRFMNCTNKERRRAGNLGPHLEWTNCFGKSFFFFILHNYTAIKIFGHYALIKEDKTYFYRYLFERSIFIAHDGRDRWTANNFVRKLYDHFAPVHLKRIQDALPYMPEPRSESFISTTSVEEGSETSDSQEMATSAPSSQGIERAKKARLKPTAML